VVWVERRGFPVVEISINPGPLDRGRHIVIDLVKGTILESGICRGRGTIIHCSLKVVKAKDLCE
jgi:hypothetical protein